MTLESKSTRSYEIEDAKAVQGPADAVGCVLIADDEALVRLALARLLRADGHRTVDAASGAEAVERLRDLPVDVVLSDIRMPDMDGIELLRQVHESSPELPVLLMTGAPDLASAVKAVEYGAFEYLSKPVAAKQLCESVRRAIDHHRAAVQRIDAPTCSPGTILGRKYCVGKLIGAGGMGTVYAAVRLHVHQHVALKVLHPRFAGRNDILMRFRREAEVAAAIHHPNIVKILDFSMSPPFLVMELLHGTTLTTAIDRDPPFSPERVARIASQILAALGAAHAAGVLHRDLKPDNVFLTNTWKRDDVVKVLDFGVAKLMDSDERKLTETGVVVGTAAYMAPEQARGEEPAIAGDIYAVGCVMYEALTGQPPFIESNFAKLVLAVQDTDPKPVSEMRSDVPPAFAAVIERAMARDASSRYATAHAMAKALDSWLR